MSTSIEHITRKRTREQETEQSIMKLEQEQEQEQDAIISKSRVSKYTTDKLQQTNSDISHHELNVSDINNDNKQLTLTTDCHIEITESNKLMNDNSQTTQVVKVKSYANEYCNAFIMIGTYHSVCAGLVFKKNKFYIKFSVKHHVGCVNEVALCDKYLVSCGADERVFLYTNKSCASSSLATLSAKQRRALREAGETLPLKLANLGSLTPPSEVRCLCFTPVHYNSANNYLTQGKTSKKLASSALMLLCGCNDGSLLCYRARDWQLQLHLPVHLKAMIQFALHPSSHGQLLVTVGADRMVAVLDLVKGRLLTKWKYTSHIISETTIAATRKTDNSTNGKDNTNKEEDEESITNEGDKRTHKLKKHEANNSSITKKSTVTKRTNNNNNNNNNNETERSNDNDKSDAGKSATGNYEVNKNNNLSQNTSHAPFLLSTLHMHREEPLGVSFSPDGLFLLVYARSSFVIYNSHSMEPLHAFHYREPVSPSDELHCVLWVSNIDNILSNCNSNNNNNSSSNSSNNSRSESCEKNKSSKRTAIDNKKENCNKANNTGRTVYVLLLGNESGQILYYAFEVDNSVDCCVYACQPTPQHVEICYSAEFASVETMNMNDTQANMNIASQQSAQFAHVQSHSHKHPRCHSSRIKAMRYAKNDDYDSNDNCNSNVIFSVDSNGVIIA